VRAVGRLRIAAAPRRSNEHENEKSRRDGPEGEDKPVPSSHRTCRPHAPLTAQRPGRLPIGCFGHRCPCSGCERCCSGGSVRSDLRLRCTTFGVACRGIGVGNFASAPAGTGRGSWEAPRASLSSQRRPRKRALPKVRAVAANRIASVGVLSSLDDWVGDQVTLQICRHHRRRLQRIGWSRALEPPAGGWASTRAGLGRRSAAACSAIARAGSEDAGPVDRAHANRMRA
jgi:hypothetical protein